MNVLTILAGSAALGAGIWYLTKGQRLQSRTVAPAVLEPKTLPDPRALSVVEPEPMSLAHAEQRKLVSDGAVANAATPSQRYAFGQNVAYDSYILGMKPRQSGDRPVDVDPRTGSTGKLPDQAVVKPATLPVLGHPAATASPLTNAIGTRPTASNPQTVKTVGGRGVSIPTKPINSSADVVAKLRGKA